MRGTRDHRFPGRRALTIGSVTKQRAMSAFSSQGPALADGGVKPELTAPGSEITAARAKGTFEEVAASEYYATISGTSMATPHVAGAAAIVKQRHPDWDAARITAALVATARPVEGAGVYEQGAGIVDAPAALAAGVTASPPAVSAQLSWPYAAVTRRTVVYRNPGTKDVRLTLEVDGDAPVSLLAKTLTVPAGGGAEVAVRIDGRRAKAGTSSAWITARGSDGSRVRTPVGVEAEGRSATLTRAPCATRPGVDRAYTTVVVQNEGTGAAELVGLAAGEERLRLPEGSYRVLGSVWECDMEGEVVVAQSTVQLAQRVALTGDRKWPWTCRGRGRSRWPWTIRGCASSSRARHRAWSPTWARVPPGSSRRSTSASTGLVTGLRARRWASATRPGNWARRCGTPGGSGRAVPTASGPSPCWTPGTTCRVSTGTTRSRRHGSSLSGSTSSAAGRGVAPGHGNGP